MESGANSTAGVQDISSYIPLVRSVVGKMAAKNWPTFDREDLMSFGIVGLMDAARRYEPGRGSFASFAVPRIRGAVLDALRANDFLPRTVRKDVRRLAEAEWRLLAEEGNASEEALESELGVTSERLSATRQASALKLVGLDLVVDDGEHTGVVQEVADSSPGALEMYLERELHEELVNLVQELPERERIIISLHFVEGLTMKEIGRVMDLSESRISQLQSRALFRLRTGLGAAA
jgi:RNA polymerase sigma factor for flagellar operon FliA